MCCPSITVSPSMKGLIYQPNLPVYHIHLEPKYHEVLLPGLISDAIEVRRKKRTSKIPTIILYLITDFK